MPSRESITVALTLEQWSWVSYALSRFEHAAGGDERLKAPHAAELLRLICAAVTVADDLLRQLYLELDTEQLHEVTGPGDRKLIDQIREARAGLAEWRLESD